MLKRGEEWRLRAFAVGFAVLLVSTLIVSVHLSTLGVGFGTRVFGSGLVQPGVGAAWLLMAYDPKAQDALPLKIDWSLRTDTQVLASGQNSGQGLVPVRVHVPTEVPIASSLHLEVRASGRRGHDTIELPLLRQNSAKPSALRWRQPALRGRPTQANNAPLNFEIFALGMSPIPSGLASPIALANFGATGEVDFGCEAFEAQHRPHPRVATGVFRPRPNLERLRCNSGVLGAAPVVATLDVAARSFAPELQPSGWLRPGDPLVLRARTLPTDRAHTLVVHSGGTWVDIQRHYPSDRRFEAELSGPFGAGPWLQLSAYRDIWGTDNDASTRVLYLGAAPPPPQLFATVGGQPPRLLQIYAASAEDLRETLLPALTAALSWEGPQSPPLMHDSTPTRQAALNARIGRWRALLHRLFVFLAIAGGIALGLILRRERRRRRANLVDYAHSDEADEDEQQAALRLAESHDWWSTAGVGIVLLLALLAVAQLIASLRWWF